jgi:NAD(P)-dependent dehydrogenase (short-subunit alcohol dehydrogenase family)/uncharacterized protein YndB with AHSA1/START domain
MARNRVHVDASPERVFAFLSDPQRYPEWVVGTKGVGSHDGHFPEPGAGFRHQVGAWPLLVKDRTEALEADPPRRLVLRARARPLPTARIEIELSERAGGTEVLIDERPANRLSALAMGNPIADAALRVRNAEALARLKRAVEDRPSGPARKRRELSRQRVLITGGSSGIGLATAQLLAGEGARVALLARSEEGLARARASLTGRGPEAVSVAADVSDRPALGRAVERAVTELGGLDVLVTSAVSIGFGRFVEIDPDDFDATVSTAFGGTVNSIRAALPHLERSGGAIVCVGSIAAHMPIPSLAAYAASKHALAGFLGTLRIELAEAGSPVTASLVNPGPVDTPLWDKLESATGLLPPVPPGSISPRSVAEVIASVIRRPRIEITVGAEARAQVALYSHLGQLGFAAMTAAARLAQAGGDRRAGPGALHVGRSTGEVEGGHGGRRSVAARTIAAWEALRSRRDRGGGAG